MILDGLALSKEFRAELKVRVDRLRSLGIVPKLDVIVAAQDPASVKKILADEFRFPPALVEKLRLDYNTQVGIDAALLEPIIEAMKKHGMVKADMKTADIVHTGN